jgi:peptide/nickel transport system permease protein
MANTSQSFQQAAWRRLRRNKGAMFGLVVIGIAIIVAIFAYFIAPDSSPYANRIILEVDGVKPGHKQSFLKIRNTRVDASSSFFTKLIYGVPDQYNYVPILSHEIKGDSIIVQKYIDEGVGERQAYLLSQADKGPVVTKKFLFGTDKYGRDILSRLIIGTRVSLSVGLVTVLISLSIGLILGSLAGYFRGKTDDIIM